MLLEGFDCLCLVILAAHSENNSPLVKIQEHSLNRQIGSTRIFRSDLNSGDPILPYDAAPKCIVKIRHQYLADLAGQRMNEMQPLIGQMNQTLRSDRHPSR